MPHDYRSRASPRLGSRGGFAAASVSERLTYGRVARYAVNLNVSIIKARGASQ